MGWETVEEYLDRVSRYEDSELKKMAKSRDEHAKAMKEKQYPPSGMPNWEVAGIIFEQQKGRGDFVLRKTVESFGKPTSAVASVSRMLQKICREQGYYLVRSGRGSQIIKE
ncbi:hypothetical protein [Anaerotalea alkaliphila]|uniref:Uncharacterized protein n=1 Tax=Anaerotalea alkaliphila TaxID=2662126 RepID=A0A7X5HXM4_9FIRM|nr:hypothetical protein [Anaerotalea alkaliphila]NDL68498.1 hypothetical protein [Anaerotalea alkaliphila]